jgi:cytochrome bd ubiquinol oxidase subunit I
MQNPVGAEFSYDTMRMEMTDFWAVVFNPTRRPSSCTPCRPATSPARCSCWHQQLVPAQGPRRRVRQAQLPRRRGFGLASVLSVIVLGDESGYTVGEAQQTKMAALEAMWETEPAPAGSR